MSKENKTIKPKNYIILGVTIIITVIAVFYMRSWYITTKEYYATNSVMLDAINEINVEELDNYILENPKFILYVSSGQNGNIKSFEKQMKKIVVDEELENITLYLNSDNTNMEQLKQKLNKIVDNENINKKINRDSAVSIYIIENGKMTRAIINAEKSSPNQIKKLLQKYGVIDNA